MTPTDASMNIPNMTGIPPSRCHLKWWDNGNSKSSWTIYCQWLNPRTPTDHYSQCHHATPLSSTALTTPRQCYPSKARSSSQQNQQYFYITAPDNGTKSTRLRVTLYTHNPHAPFPPTTYHVFDLGEPTPGYTYTHCNTKRMNTGNWMAGLLNKTYKLSWTRLGHLNGYYTSASGATIQTNCSQLPQRNQGPCCPYHGWSHSGNPCHSLIWSHLWQNKPTQQSHIISPWTMPSPSPIGLHIACNQPWASQLTTKMPSIHTDITLISNWKTDMEVHKKLLCDKFSTINN